MNCWSKDDERNCFAPQLYGVLLLAIVVPTVYDKAVEMHLVVEFHWTVLRSNSGEIFR